MHAIKLNNVIFSQLVRSDTSGCAHPYEEPDNDTRQWVVKHSVTTSPEELQIMIAQLTIMLNIDHPHILPVVAYDIQPQETNSHWDLYIKMPRMAKTLAEVLHDSEKNNIPLKSDFILQCQRAMISAVEYFHSKSIPHLNIQPDNIFLDGNDSLKVGIIATKSSTKLDNQSLLPLQNLTYTAPEVMRDNSYKILESSCMLNADIWSIGAVFSELYLSRKLLSVQNVSNKERGQHIEQIVSSLRQKYGGSLAGVVEQMFRENLKERISLLQLRKELDRLSQVVEITSKLEDSWINKHVRIIYEEGLCIKISGLYSEKEW